jgi:vacuolar protein sorting-associated protein 11
LNYLGFDGFRNAAFSLEHEQATPEDFIHFFEDSKQLIDYIEYLVRNLPNCSKFLYNTLIEHYLTLWRISDNPSNEKAGLEQRIVDLIKNHSSFYDHNHVLVLCQTYEFWLGAMLIYEEKKLYNLIVRHYLSTKEYSNLYTLCKRLGSTDPSIWLHTLNGLRLTSQVPSSFLQELLQVIANEKLLSPLQVLDALIAIDNGPNLSQVRSFFLQIFQKEDEIVQNDRSQVEKYQQESKELKQNVDTLKNEPLEFRGSLCDACRQPLNFPGLFFLCKHSFHQDCIRSFSETEKECMMCRKKNSQLLDSIHMQTDERNLQNFHEKIKSSHDPFSIVTENFSRGLFNKIVLLSEDENSNDNVLKNVDISVISKKASSSAQNVAPMTESRIRLQENLRTNIEHKAQPSEGRLRFQEKGSRQQLAPIRKDFVVPSTARSEGNNKKKQEIKASYPISANPFGDEDEDNDDDDDSKNPFKDDNDYDNALNPFADAGKSCVEKLSF